MYRPAGSSSSAQPCTARDGEVSRNAPQARHEDSALRALLHFRSEMSDGLRRHIDTRLARLKAEFLPALKRFRCNATPAEPEHLAVTVT